MERVGHRRVRRSPRLAVVLAASLLPAPVAVASDSGPDERFPLFVPDVPYVPQTTALCGGAALAMVLRYWGADGVQPEDFAAALLPSGRGITTGTLARLAEDRGYQALTFRGDAAGAGAQLEKGRPLIALAGDGPAGHYVVLLAWANGRVLLHDPAVGPFRVVPEEEWIRRWNAAERWTLLVLPGPRREEPSRETAEASRQDDPCAALVRPAVERADQGDLESARRGLAAAAELCPRSSAPLREMAGLEFRRENWAAAAELAQQAVARSRDDSLSWRLLATSRFLEGRPEEALFAWNEVGEPKLDLVSIDGLERTPFRTVYDSLGTGPDDVLTSSSLRMARRRVAALSAGRAPG
ncbi:MAG TPA: cysteine peptidase family C39 domain-containing protein [Vicinamibacteria bacterium]|nr:cysteine peptidase family C39 domain-containing protein [Vicinamibacteria bacterium]